MLKTLLHISLFLFLTSSLLGQEIGENFLVTGIVKDSESHLPLAFVTVTLQDTQTKELVGDVTDREGMFSLSIGPGKYYCIVESLSFKPFIIDILQVDQDIDMGIIELEQDIEKLREIELVAKATLVDHKNNKKIYNASKDIANIGGNAITVLENTPSVRIDEQGSITIRGNKVMVLVDGKPYGGQKSNADLLSLIPSSSISRVEIISQNAKFDSEAGGGILNIILKKRFSDGYNGMLEGHIGLPDNDGISSFVNYKTDHVNVFSTASYNHLVKIKDTEIEQVFLDEFQDPRGRMQQTREDYRQKNSFLFNLGSDFYLDEKNTLTSSILYSSSNKNYDSELFFKDYSPPEQINQELIREVDENSDENFLEAFLQYTTKFKGDQHQLSAALKYDNNSSDNETYMLNTEIFPGNAQDRQEYRKDENADNFYFSIDYALPLGENSVLEVGHKSNFRNYGNDFFSSNFSPSAPLDPGIPFFNTRIDYSESIYAFYGNYSKEFKKWSISLGLRSEATRTEIEAQDQAGKLKNDYTDLFPSALLTYKSKDKNFFSLGYTRYIDRPTIAQLNPFNSFADERFVLLGNPLLQPYYTDYTYLEYYHELDKININAALFYSNSTDRIMDVLVNTGEQTSDGYDVYTRIPVNNGTLDFTGMELQVNYNPTNKLRLFGLISPYYAQLSDTRDKAYDYDNWVWYGNARLMYKWSNTFRMNLDYVYQSAQLTALTEMKSFQYANFSMSQDLMDGNSTLSFRINDLFHTRKARFRSLEANTLTSRDFIFDTQFLLSFSYRFNKSNKRNSNNRTKDLDRDIFEIEDQIK